MGKSNASLKLIIPFIYFQGKTNEQLTAFIVDKSLGGITCGPAEDKLGIRGTNSKYECSML